MSQQLIIGANLSEPHTDKLRFCRVSLSLSLSLSFFFSSKHVTIINPKPENKVHLSG